MLLIGNVHIPVRNFDFWIFLFFHYHYSNHFLFSVKKSGEVEKLPIPKLKFKLINGDDLTVDGESDITNTGGSGESGERSDSESRESDSNVKEVWRSARLEKKNASRAIFQENIRKLRKKRKKPRAYFLQTESREMYVFASGQATGIHNLRGRLGKEKEEQR